VRAWTGSIWLRIGTGGRHLWMWSWTYKFHKMQGISWLGENRLASEGLCSMKYGVSMMKMLEGADGGVAWLLYTWGQRPGHPLGKLGWPWRWAGCNAKEKKSLLLTANDTHPVITVPSVLSLHSLSYPMSIILLKYRTSCWFTLLHPRETDP
jgi:hypothetical protein